MVFKPDQVAAFKALFDEHKSDIRAVKGCHRLELLQDQDHPNIFFTYSWWEEEANLSDYKNSELFGKVWPATKALFQEKAEAWTLEQMHVLV